MKIIPIAFDSLGTRSMATYIETNDCKIVIDPSVALGKIRYGLPPHSIEIKRQSLHWTAIKKYSKLSDILIVTHYHYDHYNPSEPDIFKNKVALLKHPLENINKNQQKRSADFFNSIKNIPRQIEYSDGREFRFGCTVIKFSSAVPHGNNNRLGYVTEVSITDGKDKLVHTSDIEGGNLDCQRDFIIQENPNVIIFDGPMTYPFQNIIPNIIQILRKTRVSDFIIDHHYLRNLKWREKIMPAFEVAKQLNKRFFCVAEFLGKECEPLEAQRKQLYQDE